MIARPFHRQLRATLARGVRSERVRRRPAPRRLATLAAVIAANAAACASDPSGPGGLEDLACGDLDPAFLADGGVGRDGIPALTNPSFVDIGTSDQTSYLTDQSRVIGVRVEDDWLAIPHNIMYRHEVVNLDRESTDIVVTYCPLTGSALAFDRASEGGAAFGVSGLLYQANLIMYDRRSNESLWPQMAGAAACGPRQGSELVRVPVVEMTWSGWKSLFPGSKVIGAAPTETDLYAINPYGASYEQPSNGDYLGFPIPRSDNRRQPKERVLGLPAHDGQPPLAFPFLAMEAQGETWVAEFEHAGEAAAVLWDQSRQAAVAVRPVADGQRLSLRVEGDRIVDRETGSVWNAAGVATSGDLSGARLPVISEAYVAFWQAWAAFHPGTELIVE